MSSGRWLRESVAYLAQTAALAVLLPVVLELRRFNFHVQFNYSGDSLWFAVPAKSVVQNGWAYFVPQLSAPYGLAAASFPAITNVDWAIMRTLALIIRDPAVAFNVFWLLTIVFTAWTALLSLRLLGVPAWLAMLGGLLYACIPFTWMRSTLHLSLVFYLVPLLCVYAVYLVRGAVHPWSETAYRRAGLVGALLQGFDYVYFSWFAVLLFGVAGLLGYAQRRDGAVLKWAAAGMATIAVAAVLNLTPAFYSWHKHGMPSIVYKIPAEAEFYGLKIRRMLVPHPANPIPPLRYWATRDGAARFPQENENKAVRLGLFGAAGFLYLTWVLLASRGRPRTADMTTVHAMAALTLVTLLVTTVGGFGAVINVLTVPDIRAYNRFSVFIAFFATAGLCLWVAARWSHASRAWKRVVVVLAVAFGSLSLYDQVLDARWISANYERDQAVANDVRTVVQRMASVFPNQTAVFQLPLTAFPQDTAAGPMRAYDHALPYLNTDRFRWSWPSLSPRHVALSRFMATVHGEALVRALATAGFGAVWVDRFGYRDQGAAVIDDVVSGGAVEVLAGTSRRYAVLDIQRVALALKDRQAGVAPTQPAPSHAEALDNGSGVR